MEAVFFHRFAPYKRSLNAFFTERSGNDQRAPDRIICGGSLEAVHALPYVNVAAKGVSHQVARLLP
jgi:hypothetical protein